MTGPPVDHIEEIKVLVGQLSTGPSPSGAQTIAAKITKHLDALEGQRHGTPRQ